MLKCGVQRNKPLSRRFHIHKGPLFSKTELRLMHGSLRPPPSSLEHTPQGRTIRRHQDIRLLQYLTILQQASNKSPTSASKVSNEKTNVSRNLSHANTTLEQVLKKSSKRITSEKPSDTSTYPRPVFSRTEISNGLKQISNKYGLAPNGFAKTSPGGPQSFASVRRHPSDLFKSFESSTWNDPATPRGSP